MAVSGSTRETTSRGRWIAGWENGRPPAKNEDVPPDSALSEAGAGGVNSGKRIVLPSWRLTPRAHATSSGSFQLQLHLSRYRNLRGRSGHRLPV